MKHAIWCRLELIYLLNRLGLVVTSSLILNLWLACIFLDITVFMRHWDNRTINVLMVLVVRHKLHFFILLLVMGVWLLIDNPLSSLKLFKLLRYWGFTAWINCLLSSNWPRSFYFLSLITLELDLCNTLSILKRLRHNFIF